MGRGRTYCIPCSKEYVRIGRHVECDKHKERAKAWGTPLYFFRIVVLKFIHFTYRGSAEEGDAGIGHFSKRTCNLGGGAAPWHEAEGTWRR